MNNNEAILRKILGVYSLILIIFGTIGNSFGIFVCLRKRLRVVPTFIFYAFMLTCDIFGLYFWNFDQFLSIMFDFELESINLTACKTIMFFQTFLFQSSAWILTAMTIERCLSSVIKSWRLRYFKSKYAIYVSIVICLISLVITSTFTSLLDTTDDKDSFNLSCLQSPIFNKFLQEHSIMYSIIPFTIMAFCNTILVYQLYLMSKRKLGKPDSPKKKIGIISVIALTIFFIICTLPTSIFGVFDSIDLYETETIETVDFALDALAFSFHAFNFLVLITANKQFRHELCELIACLKLKRGSKVSPNLSATHSLFHL